MCSLDELLSACDFFGYLHIFRMIDSGFLERDSMLHLRRKQFPRCSCSLEFRMTFQFPSGEYYHQALCRECVCLEFVMDEIRCSGEFHGTWFSAFDREMGFTQIHLGILSRILVLDANYRYFWMIVNEYGADPCWVDDGGKSHLDRAAQIYDDRMFGRWLWNKRRNRRMQFQYPDREPIHVMRRLLEVYVMKKQLIGKRIMEVGLPSVLAFMMADYHIPDVAWIEVITMEREAKRLFARSTDIVRPTALQAVLNQTLFI